MAVVGAVLMPGVLQAGTSNLSSAASGSAGAISGKVVDARGQPVPGVAVVLCEQAGGLPLARGTLRPFTSDRGQGMGGDILFSMTDPDGRFAFEKVPAGSYRLVAQSWRNKTDVKELGEVNGEEIELRGVANDVRVTDGRTSDAVLRPLGTGVLRLDQRVPNNETFLILSTVPTGADPVLGFAGWTASFLQHAIGANRMPGGKTVVRGLPEGTVYLAMFAADDVPGFLDAKVQIQAGQTAILPFTPFVAGWSDGRHDPPPELVPVYEDIKAMPRQEAQAWLAKAMAEAGIQIDPRSGRLQPADRLGREVVLPGGRKTTFGQVMAAVGYIRLQELAGRRASRAPAAKAAPSQTTPLQPDAAPSELQRRIDAAQPGATVTVPAGRYTAALQITKPLTLKGVAPQDCIVEATVDGPALLVETGGQGEVSIEGLTVQWQLASNAKGIQPPAALTVNNTNIAIRNCRFVPLGNVQRSPAAIRIDGRSKAIVSDCRFEGFDFVISYGPGAEGLVEGCILRDGGHQGITNFERSTLRVERTIVAGFKYHGLRCSGGTLHAQDNLLMDNKVSGIYLGNKDGQGTVVNNLMIRNREAVAAFYQARFDVHNNAILDSTAAGIGMWGTCRLDVAGNIFQGNAKALGRLSQRREGQQCHRRQRLLAQYRGHGELPPHRRFDPG